MRILEVCPRYPPAVGGVEEHVRQLSERLADRGHTVRVLTTEQGSQGEFDADGVEVKRFPTIAPGEAYFFTPKLERAVADSASDYDVVHAHNYHALPAFHAQRAHGKTPFVITGHYHGVGHTRLRRALHRPYRRVAAKIFENASAIIAVSRAEATRVAHDFPKSRPAVIIPNGVDIQDFQATGIPKVVGRVAIVGRLERYKNVDVALEVVRRTPSLHLSVIGDGPDRGRVESLSHQWGLGDRVTFWGRLPRAQLVARLAEAQVALSISSNEAFGISVIEALAAGTPVVASDIAAHREFADLSGVVLSEIEPAAIAAAIERAAESKLRQDDVRSYDWDQIASQTLKVFEAVL